MAEPAPSAELIIPQEYDFKKTEIFAPGYDYISQPCLESATVDLTTNGNQRTFQIPSNVYNMAKSSIQFTVASTTSVASVARMMHCDVLPFQRIEVRSQSGADLMTWDSANFASKPLMAAGITIEQLRNNGSFRYGSNDENTPGYIDVPCLNGEMEGSDSTFGVANGDQFNVADFTAPIKSKTGYRYRHMSETLLGAFAGQLSTAAANKQSLFTVRVPFSSFVHSFLSLDKDLYIPEILTVRVTFAQQSELFFTAGARIVSSGGPPVTIFEKRIINDQFINNAADNSVAGTLSASGIQLQLAKQANQMLVDSARNEVLERGLRVLFDYVYVTSQQGPASIGNQSFQATFTRGMGGRLKRVYTTIIQTGGVGGLTYQTPVDNITSYYTQINGQRLQTQNIVTSTGMDWLYNRPNLKNTSAYDKSYLAVNWLHIDNFSKLGPPLPEDSQIEQGMLMDGSIVNYTINIVAADDTAANKAIIVGAFQKEAFLTGGGIQIVQ